MKTNKTLFEVQRGPGTCYIDEQIIVWNVCCRGRRHDRWKWSRRWSLRRISFPSRISQAQTSWCSVSLLMAASDVQRSLCSSWVYCSVSGSVWCPSIRASIFSPVVTDDMSAKATKIRKIISWVISVKGWLQSGRSWSEIVSNGRTSLLSRWTDQIVWF